MFIHQVKYKFDLLPGYQMNDDCQIYSTGAQKVLSPFLNKDGRPVVCVTMEGVKKALRLDYLVISTFNRFYDDIIRVAHIDEDDNNCHISNLMAVRKVDIIKRYKEMYKVDKLEDIEEVWKTHPELPLIEISNFGNLRYKDSDKVVKTYESHDYIMISANGNHYFLHKLVAELYIDNPKPDKYNMINHIDGNKSNNVFWNLEWCDNKMNGEHAHLTGLNSTKYDEQTIRNVCELLSQGVQHKYIALITGVKKKYISEINCGRKRLDISKDYEFYKKIPLSEYYNEDLVIALMKANYKAKDIARLIKADYTPSFISYYERLRKRIM